MTDPNRWRSARQIRPVRVWLPAKMVTAVQCLRKTVARRKSVAVVLVELVVVTSCGPVLRSANETTRLLLGSRSPVKLATLTAD